MNVARDARIPVTCRPTTRHRAHNPHGATAGQDRLAQAGPGQLEYNNRSGIKRLAHAAMSPSDLFPEHRLPFHNTGPPAHAQVNVEALNDNVDHVTFADITEDDVSLMNTATTLKLIRIMQLMIEYLLNMQNHLMGLGDESRRRAEQYEEQLTQRKVEFAKKEGELQHMKRQHHYMKKLLTVYEAKHGRVGKNYLRSRVSKRLKRLKRAEAKGLPATSALETPARDDADEASVKLESERGVQAPVKPKVYPCQYCNSKFKSKHYLSLHIARRHSHLISGGKGGDAKQAPGVRAADGIKALIEETGQQQRTMAKKISEQLSQHLALIRHQTEQKQSAEERDEQSSEAMAGKSAGIDQVLREQKGLRELLTIALTKIDGLSGRVDGHFKNLSKSAAAVGATAPAASSAVAGPSTSMRASPRPAAQRNPGQIIYPPATPRSGQVGGSPATPVSPAGPRGVRLGAQTAPAGRPTGLEFSPPMVVGAAQKNSGTTSSEPFSPPTVVGKRGKTDTQSRSESATAGVVPKDFPSQISLLRRLSDAYAKRRRAEIAEDVRRQIAVLESTRSSQTSGMVSLANQVRAPRTPRGNISKIMADNLVEYPELLARWRRIVAAQDDHLESRQYTRKAAGALIDLASVRSERTTSSGVARDWLASVDSARATRSQTYAELIGTMNAAVFRSRRADEDVARVKYCVGMISELRVAFEGPRLTSAWVYQMLQSIDQMDDDDVLSRARLGKAMDDASRALERDETKREATGSAELEAYLDERKRACTDREARATRVLESAEVALTELTTRKQEEAKQLAEREKQAADRKRQLDEERERKAENARKQKVALEVERRAGEARAFRESQITQMTLRANRTSEARPPRHRPAFARAEESSAALTAQGLILARYSHEPAALSAKERAAAAALDAPPQQLERQASELDARIRKEGWQRHEERTRGTLSRAMGGFQESEDLARRKTTAAARASTSSKSTASRGLSLPAAADRGPSGSGSLASGQVSSDAESPMVTKEMLRSRHEQRAERARESFNREEGDILRRQLDEEDAKDDGTVHFSPAPTPMASDQPRKSDGPAEPAMAEVKSVKGAGPEPQGFFTGNQSFRDLSQTSQEGNSLAKSSFFGGAAIPGAGNAPRVSAIQSTPALSMLSDTTMGSSVTKQTSKNRVGGMDSESRGSSAAGGSLRGDGKSSTAKASRSLLSTIQSETDIGKPEETPSGFGQPKSSQVARAKRMSSPLGAGLAQTFQEFATEGSPLAQGRRGGSTRGTRKSRLAMAAATAGDDDDFDDY